MDAAKDEMVSIVTNAGGSMTFDALKAAMSLENVKYMPRAFRELKAENRLRKVIRVVDGAPVHEVYVPETSA